jgi:hypothetical protein
MNAKRRSFLRASVVSFSLAILGQTSQTASQPQPTQGSRCNDRFGEHHTLGVSSTELKVCTSESRGGLGCP